VGTWNCNDRGMGGTCTQDTAMLKIKFVTSTEFCNCVVGTTTYDYAEANPVDPGPVEGDDTPRWKCPLQPIIGGD
jgi:hypothetical protein